MSDLHGFDNRRLENRSTSRYGSSRGFKRTMTQLKLQEGAMGVVDTVIVFRILKMMTRKWEEMDAFKFGLIDANGKRIKGVKPKTSEEKNSFTLLHRLVFNLKEFLNYYHLVGQDLHLGLHH